MFYDSPNGTRLSIDVGNNTMTTIKNLDPELNYTVFVVAYGGYLPSAASDKSNISEGLSVYCTCTGTEFCVIIMKMIFLAECNLFQFLL